MALITQTELINGTGYVNLGQPSVINNLVARTYMYYGKITGVENPGAICVKGGADSVGGPRMQVSSSNTNVQLTTPTSGSNLAPSIASSNGTVVFNEWVNLAISWNGVTAVNLNAKIYKNGSNIVGDQTAGSSPYLTGAGFDFMMFNRGDGTRALLGSHAYVAVWNRVLSDAEVAQAAANGPLSVSSGLVLCWANGQDYSTNAITASSRSTFAAGDMPPNTALGGEAAGEIIGTLLSVESGKDTLVATGGSGVFIEGDLSLTEPAKDTLVSTGGTVSASDLFLVYNEDSMNAHPTLSTIVDPSTSTPTVNIHVRVIYSSWRQFYFKLTNATSKRPLFKIINPANYTSSFNSSWRPWYSYDGINWLRFDTAPVNNTTTWDFQLSTSFTGGTVYVAYQPAWPLWRAPWLINELEAINANKVHELPSAPSYMYPTTMSNQTDELGNTVPGQKMYAFGVWDNALNPSDGSTKRIAIISGGMHAGEHVGSWGMEGFLRFLLSGDAKATTLLQNFKFYVYPLVNPMGRFMGHYRGQRDPISLTLDPNRDWPVDSTPSKLQSTLFTKAMMAIDMGSNKAAVALDFHATWGYSANTAYYYYDTNCPYITQWDARVKTYSNFDDRVSTVVPDTTMNGGVYRLYEPYHAYTPETYEAGLFNSISDVTNVGVVYAKSVADTPLTELRLPSEITYDSSGDMLTLEAGPDHIFSYMEARVTGTVSVQEPNKDLMSNFGGAFVGKVARSLTYAGKTIYPYLSEGFDEFGNPIFTEPYEIINGPVLSQIHNFSATLTRGISYVGSPVLETQNVVTINAIENTQDQSTIYIVSEIKGSSTSIDGIDSIQSVGKVVITGTYTVTENTKDSFDGTYVSVIVGSLSLTENTRDTLSNNADLVIKGTFYNTEVGTDTIAGNVTTLVSMASSITESGKDVISATGGIVLKGSSSVIEVGKDLLSINIKNLVKGSTSISEVGKDSFVSTSDNIVTGRLTSIEPSKDIINISGEIETVITLVTTENTRDYMVSSLDNIVSGHMITLESPEKDEFTLTQSRKKNPMAAISNLYMDQGSDFNAEITLTSSTGVPLPLAECEVHAQMRKYPTSSVYYSFDCTIIDENNGVIKLAMSDEYNNDIPEGRWLYDVEVTYSNGKTKRVLQGLILVSGQITRVASTPVVAPE